VIARAVVLAAGQGARLGGVAKALLDAGDRSFLARIVETAAAAGVEPGRIMVVVGAPFGDAVAAEAARLGARVAVNPDPARGMASSVAVGFAALDADARGDVALLWPVDHPAVAADTVARVLAAAADVDVVVPRHRGRGGHPAAVARPVWAALAAAADAHAGARTVLADPRWRRRDLAVDDPGVVRDVDDRADLTGRW
jgi:CTP:molybdopterin cytidylyltransferase MocA